MNVRCSSIREELENKGHIVYTTSGVSMMPLLRQKQDLVLIESRERYEAGGGIDYSDGCGPRRLKAGDAVLFTRGERLVLHRIMEAPAGDSEGVDDTYIICGDNQYTPEYVRGDRIIGIMTGFVRDGVETSVDDPEYLKYVAKIMKRPMSMRKFIVYWRALWRKLGVGR